MFDLEQIKNELNKIDSIDNLKIFYQTYLWKNGLLTNEFKTLWKLPQEERKNKWKELTETKNILENIYSDKELLLKRKEIDDLYEKEIIDITTPPFFNKIWFQNLISKNRRNIEEIFRWMWFSIEYWNEIVTKYENFYSVNIPESHPATEMQDTFYLNQVDWNWENLILRTHTSSMQNKLICKYWVPCKIVIPWKVYRYENTDASHDTVFWQVEWIVIDKNISIANFKSNITEILSAIFGCDVTVRMRPWFFPFVEPWFEIDASCPICKWDWCALCKKTWRIEIIWAWMIHPNVLSEAWVNPEQYSWFAFWMWLTRLVAIKYWIKDIRLFNSWDLKFLESFY